MLLFGLVSLMIFIVGCGLQPGKSIAGQAVAGYSDEGCVEGPYLYEVDGQIVGSDTGCTTMNPQGVFNTEAAWCPTQTELKGDQQVYVSGGRWQWCLSENKKSEENFEQENSASEQESHRATEDTPPDESGYGGSEPEGGVTCGHITMCDGADVTGTDGQVVCDKELKESKCTANGWAATGKICECPGKKKCGKKMTCFGVEMGGWEGALLCGNDLKEWQCMATGWKVTGKDCLCKGGYSGNPGEGGSGGKCKETDKGKNFLVKGQVKFVYDTLFGEVEKVVAEDYCHTFKDGSVYLFEGICGDTYFGKDPFYYVQKKCEDGGEEKGLSDLNPPGNFMCKEGKCVINPCLVVAQQDDSFQIPFKDAQLEKAIKEALGIAKNKPVTFGLAKGVTILMLSSKNIQDLSGLEYFSNLEELFLNDNFIVDLTPLACLKNLIVLDLKFNDIVEINSLQGLTKLKELYLSHNKISDITVVKGLTELKELWLSNNQIVVISAVGGLTELKLLWLSNNQIVDISAVKGLIQLIDLNLNHNQISDISALQGLTKLIALDLYSNKISDLSALQWLTQLKYLDLGENKISDISVLKGMTQLIELNFYDNKISDISVLQGLTKLEFLGLPSNQISDISALKGLTSLTGLALWNNKITDLSALQGLTKLTWLTLSYNQIIDISPLKELTKLEHLELVNNKIKDISALKGLANLNKLYLENNLLPPGCVTGELKNKDEIHTYLVKCAK